MSGNGWCPVQFSYNSFTWHYIFTITDSFVVTSEGHEVDSRIFFITFQPHYGTGIDAACNKKEHQDYFLGGKDDQCTGLSIFLPSCVDCWEILGASNSMKPWRPVQALPLHVLLHKAKENPCMSQTHGLLLYLPQPRGCSNRLYNL